MLQYRLHDHAIEGLVFERDVMRIAYQPGVAPERNVGADDLEGFVRIDVVHAIAPDAAAYDQDLGVFRQQAAPILALISGMNLRSVRFKLPSFKLKVVFALVMKSSIEKRLFSSSIKMGMPSITG